MPVYFIDQDDIFEKGVQVPPPLTHHLMRVLRYREGDTVIFMDKTGRRYGTQIIAIAQKQINAQILWESVRTHPPRIHLHVGMACLKGARMDGVIEKSVELGVMRISPLITRRVIAKCPTDRKNHQQQRWEAIAREAAQQSERWEIPGIDPPLALSSFLEQTQRYPFKLIFWEGAAPTLSLRKRLAEILPLHATSDPAVVPSEAVQRSEPVAVLIGPEGGWEKEEIDYAQSFGYHSVSLGDRPLRADTAAVAALSLLMDAFENGYA